MEITVNRETRRFVRGEVTLFVESAVPSLSEGGKGAVRFDRFYEQAAKLWFARCEAMAEELPPGRYSAVLCCSAEMGEREGVVRGCMCLCFRGRPMVEEAWEQRWKMPGGYLLPPKRQKATKSKRRKVLP